MNIVPTASTPLNHEKDVMAGLIMVGCVRISVQLQSNNYLLSIFPFFKACTNDDSPFSCLKVTHTSSRKSKAISSFTKCSLINISNTVGGTEPFPVCKKKEIFEICFQVKICGIITARCE